VTALPGEGSRPSRVWCDPAARPEGLNGVRAYGVCSRARPCPTDLPVRLVAQADVVVRRGPMRSQGVHRAERRPGPASGAAECAGVLVGDASAPPRACQRGRDRPPAGYNPAHGVASSRAPAAARAGHLPTDWAGVARSSPRGPRGRTGRGLRLLRGVAGWRARESGHTVVLVAALRGGLVPLALSSLVDRWGFRLALAALKRIEGAVGTLMGERRTSARRSTTLPASC